MSHEPIRYKMYCIFAKESIDKMGGNRGKLASMAGHAYLHSFWDAMKTNKLRWNQKAELGHLYKNSGIAVKITLVVPTSDELTKIQERYKDVCGTSLVIDAARTVFSEPTTVCLGLGPLSIDMIGEDIKAMKVLI